MRTKKFKAFPEWEYEKEEAWLNELAAKGQALVSLRSLYEFEETEPGEYIIRMELLSDGPKSLDGEKYIRFVEDTGAEYIGHSGKWVYFRRKAAEGPFELHSDNETRIRHLQRIIRSHWSTITFNIVMGSTFLLRITMLEQKEYFWLLMLAILFALPIAIALVGLQRKNASWRRKAGSMNKEEYPCTAKTVLSASTSRA